MAAQATRVGGSLMRIYRDTRFSQDRIPSRTNIGIPFRHAQAKDVHAPGYYADVDPEQVFPGVGMLRRDREPLQRIRERIAARPGEWRRVVNDR